MSGSGEQWRSVPSFEGIYSVSDQGNVRRDGGDLLNPWLSSAGYSFVRLSDGLRRVTVQVHRLVIAAFVGPCPANKEVNHKNGIKSDPRLENLEYVTRSENVKHAIRLGLLKPPSRKGIPWKPPEGWTRAQAEFTCEYCKSAFFDVPSAKRRFCSKKCRYAAGREATHIKAVCPICNTEFEYLRSWPLTYCSKVCAGKATYHHLGKYARVL